MTGSGVQAADVFSVLTSFECFELVRALFISDNLDTPFHQQGRCWTSELDCPPAGHHHRGVFKLKIIVSTEMSRPHLTSPHLVPLETLRGGGETDRPDALIEGDVALQGDDRDIVVLVPPVVFPVSGDVGDV